MVVMTTFSTRDHVVAALRAGASGYLVKGVNATGIELMPLMKSERMRSMRGACETSRKVSSHSGSVAGPASGAMRTT